MVANAYRAIFLALLMGTAACTHTVGHDFKRPEQMGVMLGQTTESDILSRYGAPSSRNSISGSTASRPGKQPSPFDAAPVPGVFSYLRYGYVVNRPPIAGGDMNQKAATFTFWNGALVAFDFTSSFAVDNSNFDEDNAQTLLASRQITRQETVARFGEPGGVMIYPITPMPGMERLHYSYQKFDTKLHQRQIKVMDIVFNASGQMIDYQATSAANPFAPSVPPASGGGLLLLPVGHAGGGRR